MEKFKIEEKIVAMLKTVYDPEIPVNVYDLGLIYKIDVSDNGEAVLDGTAIIVEDKEEKRTALDAITVRYKSLCPRPAPDSMINRVAIIRIDID